jgi:hypothetical protein
LTNKYCPLCGEENKCMAGAGEQGNCWCNDQLFPNGIFDLLPAESRKKHCICIKCLNTYREENKQR